MFKKISLLMGLITSYCLATNNQAIDDKVLGEILTTTASWSTKSQQEQTQFFNAYGNSLQQLTGTQDHSAQITWVRNILQTSFGDNSPYEKARQEAGINLKGLLTTHQRFLAHTLDQNKKHDKASLVITLTHAALMGATHATQKDFKTYDDAQLFNNFTQTLGVKQDHSLDHKAHYSILGLTALLSYKAAIELKTQQSTFTQLLNAQATAFATAQKDQANQWGLSADLFQYTLKLLSSSNRWGQKPDYLSHVDQKFLAAHKTAFDAIEHDKRQAQIAQQNRLAQEEAAKKAVEEQAKRIAEEQRQKEEEAKAAEEKRKQEEAKKLAEEQAKAQEAQIKQANAHKEPEARLALPQQLRVSTSKSVSNVPKSVKKSFNDSFKNVTLNDKFSPDQVQDQIKSFTANLASIGIVLKEKDQKEVSQTAISVVHILNGMGLLNVTNNTQLDEIATAIFKDAIETNNPQLHNKTVSAAAIANENDANKSPLRQNPPTKK